MVQGRRNPGWELKQSSLANLWGMEEVRGGGFCRIRHTQGSGKWYSQGKLALFVLGNRPKAQTWVLDCSCLCCLTVRRLLDATFALVNISFPWQLLGAVQELFQVYSTGTGLFKGEEEERNERQKKGLRGGLAAGCQQFHRAETLLFTPNALTHRELSLWA